MTFGIIYLQGIEDLQEDIPERVTANVMKKVVDNMKYYLRGSDMVARWNKLEFAVLLPTTPEYAGLRTFERLLNILSKPVQIGQQKPIYLSPRAGIVGNHENDSSEEIIERAEITLNETRFDTKLKVWVK